MRDVVRDFLLGGQYGSCICRLLGVLGARKLYWLWTDDVGPHRGDFGPSHLHALCFRGGRVGRGQHGRNHCPAKYGMELSGYYRTNASTKFGCIQRVNRMGWVSQRRQRIGRLNLWLTDVELAKATR